MCDEAKKKAQAIATEMKHRFQARKPDFTPKWSREWVIPDNVLKTAEVKVEMQVDSNFPASRLKADIEVTQAWDGKHVPAVPIPPLALKDKKVLKAAGGRPFHKFTHKNAIWEQFDKLEYNFSCTIDQTTIATAKPLKVKRWHVQAVDSSDYNANRPNNIYDKYRVDERSNFLSAFAGSVDDEAFATKDRSFNARTATFAGFGEMMQNTYTFVYTGHGSVMCRECGMAFDGFPDDSEVYGPRSVTDKLTPAERDAGFAAFEDNDANFGRWTTCPRKGCRGAPRSVHCIGGFRGPLVDVEILVDPNNPRTLNAQALLSYFDGAHVANDSTVPTTPKYLMFSVCCGGAFETSLYDAYIGRGTKYCIGFKKSTKCTWARDYAKSFFDTWVKTHKCDPAKIPEVFDGLQATWGAKLQPVLFGRDAGLASLIRNLGRKIGSAL